jgi:hypothetical protein
MPGRGTGVPNWFLCPTERRERLDARWRGPYALNMPRHTITLTGRTRPTKPGNGHPRKSWTTREWTCSCGRTGWSNHIDLEHLEARGPEGRLT